MQLVGPSRSTASRLTERRPDHLPDQPSGPIAHYFSSVSSTIRLADEASVVRGLLPTSKRQETLALTEPRPDPSHPQFQLAHLKKILRFFKDRVIKQRVRPLCLHPGEPVLTLALASAVCRTS